MTLNLIKQKDLKFGFNSENNLLTKMKELFGSDIEKTGRYNIFDFENDNYLIELKTRRIYSNQYKDIMIGLNKIKKAQNTKLKICVFLWKLKDGLFMWEFNDKEYTTRLGGRCDRGVDERKIVAFIPMNILKKI